MFRSQFLEHFVCENKRVFNRLILFFSLEPFRLYARHVKDVASGEGRAQLHATELPRGSWGLRISLARDARLFAAKGQSSLEPVDRACVLQAISPERGGNLLVQGIGQAQAGRRDEGKGNVEAREQTH
eukprot:GHVT01090022.1.p3 GENE.GHVT01090022.1~~GHVT01090022.1.p3  ORF type:complete len:128 (+),score=26.07 GHVT01090022.1:565-948(+)